MLATITALSLRMQVSLKSKDRFWRQEFLYITDFSFKIHTPYWLIHWGICKTWDRGWGRLTSELKWEGWWQVGEKKYIKVYQIYCIKVLKIKSAYYYWNLSTIRFRAHMPWSEWMSEFPIKFNIKLVHYTSRVYQKKLSFLPICFYRV